MAKRISQLLQILRAEIAQNDLVPIVDVSAGKTKYATIADAFGIPDITWTPTGETHAYSAWDSTIRQGIITVPTNATTKYQPGMRYRITQATGGTKYGIIMAVSATTLTVLFPVGTTLNNEAITSPMYSSLKSPFGFDADPLLWQLELTDTTSRVQSSPSNGTVYNTGSLSMAIGIGLWRVYLEGTDDPSSSSGVGDAQFGFSTSNNSFSDSSTIAYIVVNARAANKSHIEKTIKLAAKTTYYIVHGTLSGSFNDIVLRNNVGTLVFRAVPAYL